jgi:hypothetical protein
MISLPPLHLLCLKFVYYESIKREVNRRLIYECRCDERLKPQGEGSTRLSWTGFRGGLEHLKIETRLIDERFPSVMGECEIVTVKVSRLYLQLYVKLPPWPSCYVQHFDFMIYDDASA